MKIVKVALISIAVLLVAAIAGLVIFIKTFDVMKYKPQIVEQAAKALGRGVDFEKAALGISLSQGIRVRINDLAVAEDPKFAPGDFLTVKEVSLGLDALGLLQKKVNIPSVIIDSARMSIIRNKDGTINAATIGQPKKEGTLVPEKRGWVSFSSGAKSGQDQKIGPDLLICAAYAQQQPAVAALPAVNIVSLKVTNSTVVYLDRMFEPALSVEVSKLDAEARGFSLTDKFPFTAQASVLSQKQNIKADGFARLDLATNSVTFSGLKANTDLSQLVLDKIPAAFPMTKGSPLPQQLKGTLEVSVDNVTAGPQGASGLQATAVLKDGFIAMKELASPVKDLNETIRITPTEIIIDKSTFTLGEGSITSQGKVQDYLTRQAFTMNVDVEKLRLQDLVPQTAPVKAEGLVSGTITTSGTGFTPEALKETLSGLATMGLTQGKLKGINVLRSVLDQIAIIPGLSQQLEAGLPQRWKEKLAAKDTVLSDLKLPVTIENGRFIVKDTAIGADEFIFKGAGQAGLSGAFSVQGDFLIPKDLSAAMVAQVKQLEYLVNDSGQIYIPLKVNGTAGAKPVFFVDPEYMAKRILMEQGAKQLFKALDKALGGKKEEPAQTGQAPSGQTPAQGQPTQNATQQDGSQQPTTEQAVKDIFRGIFGK